MSRLRIVCLLKSLVCGVAAMSSAQAETFNTTLSGFQEVPTLFSSAHGSLQIKVHQQLTSLDYVLRYNGLRSVVTQAHLHFGKAGTNGAVMAFLCTNLGNAPSAETPPCPSGEQVTVSGSLNASQVVGPAAQGIGSGEFAKLLAALRAGAVYGNVHTTAFPGGELRGQLPRHAKPFKQD